MENTAVEERIRTMQAQVDGVMAAVRNTNVIEDIVDKTGAPFTPAVMACPFPPKFKMPTVDPYDGTKDPLDHLDTYNSAMHLHTIPDKIKCRAFSITLKGPAEAWFNKIKPGSIGDFKQLSKQFASHFIGGQWQRKPPAHLLTVGQGKDESLRDYVNRFNREMLDINEAEEKVAITAFMSGLKLGRFAFSLAKNPLESMAELMSRAQKHMNAEDAMKARKDMEASASRSEKRHQTDVKGEQDSKMARAYNSGGRPEYAPNQPPRRISNFTLLNFHKEQVLCHPP